MDRMSEVKFLLKYKMRPMTIRDLLLAEWASRHLHVDINDLKDIWEWWKGILVKNFNDYFDLHIDYHPRPKVFKELERVYNEILTFM